jgi:tellurite resistance protein TerC
MWAGFSAIVLAMLAVDLLLVGGGRGHKVSLKEAATWSAVWVGLSLSFAGALWLYLEASSGRELADAKTLEFLTGYLIEKALSVDNVFVWLMLFSYFAVPPHLQKRVLIYGVLGAIVMRAGMIFAGVWLIEHFHWILYVFGAFLLATGAKMLLLAQHKPDLEKNPLLRWLRGRQKGGRLVRLATPLFLALVLVEVSDLIFAVDSIPAIFAVSTDPFIVLTSNVFAILGLRAMYFLLADFADRFALLKYGLAIVLIFIGLKMLLIDLVKIPVGLSLGIVAAVIASSMILSLYRHRPGSAPARE